MISFYYLLLYIMREQSAQKVADLLTQILEGAINNIPPYVSGLMFRYQMYSLFCTVLWIVLVWLTYLVWKNLRSLDEEDIWSITWSVIMIFAFTMIWAGLIFCNAQWIFLPELSMLEYLKH